MQSHDNCVDCKNKQDKYKNIYPILLIGKRQNNRTFYFLCVVHEENPYELYGKSLICCYANEQYRVNICSTCEIVF